MTGVFNSDIYSVHIYGKVFDIFLSAIWHLWTRLFQCYVEKTKINLQTDKATVEISSYLNAEHFMVSTTGNNRNAVFTFILDIYKYTTFWI